MSASSLFGKGNPFSDLRFLWGRTALNVVQIESLFCSLMSEREGRNCLEFWGRNVHLDPF